MDFGDVNLKFKLAIIAQQHEKSIVSKAKRMQMFSLNH